MIPIAGSSRAAEGTELLPSSRATEYHRLLETVHDGIAIAHEDGVAFRNRAMCALLPQEEPVLRTPSPARLMRFLLNQVVRSDRSCLATALVRVLRKNESGVECEVRVISSDEPRFVIFFLDAVSFSGRPSLMISGRDVSESRRIKELLNRSERMAAIGTLAAGVAHEINNPLSYLTTNLEYSVERVRYLDQILLGRSVQVESPARLRMLLGPLLSALKEAHDGSSRVARIVSDLKVLSRESDNELLPLDLWQAIDTAVHMAERAYCYRAQFKWECPQGSRVWGTETRIVQVFLNLLVNAAQAFRTDDPTHNLVTIRAWVDQQVTVVEVTDNGPGILREDHERIFAPFFTTKPVGEGTGLGLSICHGIVYASGGTVSVESEPDKGATFRVCLRTSDREAPASSSRRSVRPSGRARILIVDDEVLLVRSLTRLLQEQHVTSAANGREGLERILKDGPFDLVLCDLMMPEMTGMDLFEEVRRKDPQIAELFIFITGGAFSDKARAFLASVTNPKLEKPVPPHLLRNIVATALGAES
jgi:two-component system, cell cycle sensor histidine kinase and response regulator CckA